MTVDQFFKELRNTNKEWYVKEDKSIRCKTGDCPIIAVGRYRDFDLPIRGHRANLAFDSVGSRLGLKDDLIIEIMRAADGRTAHDKNIRRRLLTLVKKKS